MVTKITYKKNLEKEWKNAFFFTLLFLIFSIGMLVWENEQSKSISDYNSYNSECTGYEVDDVVYCNKNSYQLYLRTLLIIENIEQQRSLEKIN